MKLIYIKFRHKDDIFAIQPGYDLKPPGEFVQPRICGRCGDTLYIPVELPEDAVIQQPMGEAYRPFPIENPGLVIRGEPEPMTLFVPLDKPSLDEKGRLKRFRGMVFVDDNGFEMMIADVSRQPVKHECEQQPDTSCTPHHSGV